MYMSVYCIQVAHRRTAIPDPIWKDGKEFMSLKPGAPVDEYLISYMIHRIQMKQFRAAQTMVEKADRLTRASLEMSKSLKVSVPVQLLISYLSS